MSFGSRIFCEVCEVSSGGVIPEPAASRRKVTLSYRRSHKHQTPPPDPEGGRGSHTRPKTCHFHREEEPKEQPSVKGRRKHPFSTRILDSWVSNSKLHSYDRKGDSDEHMQHVDDRLDYYHVNEALKCNLFTLTLTGSTMICFKSLPNKSIYSWTKLCKNFIARSTYKNSRAPRDNSGQKGKFAGVYRPLYKSVSRCGKL